MSVRSDAAGFPWALSDTTPFWVQPQSMPVNRVTISSDTLFALDSAELTGEGAAELSSRITPLARPGAKFKIDAWASAEGDGSYNMRLSLARAAAVAAALERIGISKLQVDIVAHGEDDLPVRPPTDPRNRVVVVSVAG